MVLLLYTLIFLPLVQAWTFRYTNATNNATILHEIGTLNCTEIDLAGGKLFSWDPEGAKLCVLIFYDAKCLRGAGYSCPFWKKLASRNFYGVKIIPNEETASVTISTAIRTSATSVATSAITTASTSSITTPIVTISSTPVASKSSSPPHLSGGAISGVVIGVFCAVLIIATIFFFCGRRQKQNAVLANQRNTPQGSYKTDKIGQVEADALMSSRVISEKPTDPYSVGFRPAPGSRFVELAGQDRTAELANRPLHELDTRNERPHHWL